MRRRRRAGFLVLKDRLNGSRALGWRALHWRFCAVAVLLEWPAVDAQLAADRLEGSRAKVHARSSFLDGQREERPEAINGEENGLVRAAAVFALLLAHENAGDALGFARSRCSGVHHAGWFVRSRQLASGAGRGRRAGAGQRTGKCATAEREWRWEPRGGPGRGGARCFAERSSLFCPLFTPFSVTDEPLFSDTLSDKRLRSRAKEYY